MKKNTLERLRKCAAAVAGAALLGMPFSAYADPNPNITICHATASATNPYVVETVDADSILNGDGHGHSGINDGDIVPPFTSGNQSYPGHNWDAAGQAIWNNGCNPVPPPAQTGALVVIKDVINDDGGQALPGYFSIGVASATSSANVPGSPAQGSSLGTTYILSPGTYTVSELTASSSYAATFSGDCNANGSVSVSAGATSTCRITNNDIASGGGGGNGGQAPGALVVQKVVINDDGGTASSSSFTLTVKSATTTLNVAGSPFSGSSAGTGFALGAGSYVVGETASSTYTATFSGACDQNGNVTITSGATSTCVVTNNDVASGGGGNGGSRGILLVKKVVINDNGGTATSSDFQIGVKNASSTIVAGPFAGSAAGTSLALAVGSYTVYEATSTSYAATFSGACNSQGVVSVSAGTTSTCVITNNDIATSTQGGGGGGCTNNCGLGLLTIIKHALGGNGTFSFSLTGGTVATTSITTAGGTGTAIIPLLHFGTTTISESSQAGWSLTGISCTQNGLKTGSTTAATFSFNVQPLGEIVICDVFNATSTATSTPGGGGGGGSGPTTGSIVVIKQVVGGTASSSDFAISIKNATSSSATSSLNIAGSPQPGSATGTIYMNVATGTYAVSESGGPGGYTASFSGACDSSGMLTVTAGATSTCTITNTFPSNNGGGGGGGGGGGTPSGGGGGNGPIVGTFGSGGGGGSNGPILGGGGFSPGQVLGNSISLPDGMGGYVPGVPDTGAGGFATTYLILLMASAATVAIGMSTLRKARV